MRQIKVIAPDRVTSISIQDGTTILAGLQQAGWHVAAPCGGAGTCGKCVVTVDPPGAGGPRASEEERFTRGDSSMRLACRCRPIGDVRVTLPSGSVAPRATGSVAKGGTIESGPPVAAIVRRHGIQLDEPSLGDQRSVIRRLRDTLGIPTLRAGASTLNAALALIATPCDAIVATFPDEPPTLIGIRATEAKTPLLAIAFDIGTTTVAGYLVDLESGMVLASESMANEQARFGADVISRIAAAGDGAPLSRTIQAQLSEMAERICAHAGTDAQSVLAGSIVGNTTMIHFLLGLDPTAISRTPFTPVSTELSVTRSVDAGIGLDPNAAIVIPPGVSGYVGADIIADLLSCGMHDEPATALLIDIGTNGELVLNADGRLLACSTAAGPAFEGATIRHGSGGIAGAISHIRREGSDLVVETVDDENAASICGTGLMDALAMLLDDRIVDETGRMSTDDASPDARAAYVDRVIDLDGEPAVVLSAPGSLPRIVLTQADVRQVQLAKAAIAAGILVLLEHAGKTTGDVASVYLAGGFGTYVRPEAAIRVGLLPGFVSGQIRAIGNAAGSGAVRMLINGGSGDEARRIVDSCSYIELSGSVSFQNHYMEQMMFPEVE